MFSDASLSVERRRFLLSLTALVAVAILLGAAKFLTELKAYGYIGKEMGATNTITVSGDAEVFVKPDIATISFSVLGKGTTPALAQEKVNVAMAKITDYLEKAGINDKDIKTTNFSSSPTYQYPDTKACAAGYPCYPYEGERTISSYEVQQWTEVKIRKIDEANKILGGLGELGATNISGISFTVDDEEGYQEDARKEAIAEAKERAERLADDLGVRLGRVVSFSDGGNYPIYYKAMDATLGRGGAESAPAPTISVGENKIISSVTIVYEIR